MEQCLYTVMMASKNTDTEIIVVDNGSSDNCIASLQSLFPAVHFIRSDQNMGFAKANNLALIQAKGAFVLFLNPDTLVAENTLTSCLLHLEENKTVGAIGVRMINGFGEFLPESKRARPTLLNAFFKLSGLAKLFPSSPVFNRYALGHLSCHTIHEAEVLAGAFMMVRKKILDNLGGFDPSFFMYGEDIDLSVRIGKAGYGIHYLGQLPVIHYKGQSSKNRSVYHTAVFFKAMQIFVWKHYRLGFLLVPFIQISSLFSQVKKMCMRQNRTLSVLNEPNSLLLICHQKYEQNLLNLLKKEQQYNAYQSTILTNHRTMNDISIAINERMAKQVLIQIPDISMQDAISLMEKHEGLFFRFVFGDTLTLTFNN